MPPADPPDWLAGLPAQLRDRVESYQASRPPSPMLATVSEPGQVPSGWGFQRKWDGMRVLLDTGPAGTKLWARSGRNVTASFPELASRLDETVDREAIVDGEILVLRGGEERFGLLQRRMNVEEPSPSLVAEVPVQLAVFDVLTLDGFDVRGLPQRERERLLHEIAPEMGDVILAETVAHGQPPGHVRRAACELGWEGLIAKDPEAPYRQGRHSAWRKLKCWEQETFTVVGYREMEGGGGVGSLVVAEIDDGRLSKVGGVGTGLDDGERRRLHERLQPLRREDPPVEEDEAETHWVEPELAVEVTYGERTPDGNLRHPRLRGLASLEPREARP